MTDNRLLPPSALPSTMWDPTSNTLILPKLLSNVYVKMIEDRGLRELGTSRNHDDGPVGGIDQESTDIHFAKAFDGSAARALLAVLDPKCEVGTTSDDFIRVTAGSSLVVTDAPCGAGAASFAFLTAIAELREHCIIPRMPLKVVIVCADISLFARNYVEEIHNELRDKLEEQGIFVEIDLRHWDVSSAISTSDLVKVSIITSSLGTAKMLIVANFTGYLEQNGRRKKDADKLEELFRYATGDNSFAVWIEPQMNRAIKPDGLLGWVFGMFKSLKNMFSPLPDDLKYEDAMFRSESNFRLPLQPENCCKVRLAVIPMNLTRASE